MSSSCLPCFAGARVSIEEEVVFGMGFCHESVSMSMDDDVPRRMRRRC